MPSKHSILNEARPYTMPQPEKTNKPKPKKSDWVKLAKSKPYPEIEQYLQAKIEYYRHYLPGGTAMREAKEKGISDTEIGRWAECASVIIDEIQSIRATIQNELENDRIQSTRG